MRFGQANRPPELAQHNRTNILAAAFGLTGLGFFTALYVLRRDIYFTVIDLWSFRPFRYPFIDLVYIPAQISCWDMGIDVYLRNPCDPLGRLHDYSPLWLRLSFLADIKPFINWLGLSMAALFMLSLAALPRPRRRSDYLPLLLGIVSPMTVFALERGNIDTLMFLFAMITIVCMDRALPLRLLGYGAIMLASLLKFYPFVLFILLLRERLRVFLITAAAAIGLMGSFIWFYLDEVRRMAANIPQPSIFTDSFGAAQLPAGTGILAERLLERLGLAGMFQGGLPSRIYFGLPLTVLLIATAYAAARHIAHREDFRAAAQSLTRRESLTLVAGAALVCGCFVSGRSIGYREIMILMAIPGLSALALTSPTRTLSRIMRSTLWVAIFLLFFLPPQRLLYNLLGSLATDGISPIAVAFWLVRETCWWWLVTVLAAALIRFVLDSPMRLATSARWWKPRAVAG